MDAGVIVTRLRAAGYLPALFDGTVRLYGDAAKLPPALREALTASREAVVAYLGRPEQSIAYDLLAAAIEAGWSPVVTQASLAWRRGEERTATPLRSRAFRDAMAQHRDAVSQVLHQAPLACAPEVAGRCPASLPVALPAPIPEPPPECPYHRIWTCTGCHLPRSGDDRPCPGCGSCDGYVALRPANRFTGLR